MKMKYITIVILSMFLFASNIFAQAASVTWPLTSDQNPNVPTGNIQALPETIGTGTGNYLLSIFNPYVANGQRLWTGNQGTGWIAGLPDYTRFIQFDSSPTNGNNLTIQSLSFQYSDNPLNTDFNIIKAEVWYSIDGWNTKTQLNTSPLNYLNTSVQMFSKSINILVQNGQTFSIRIYPYTLNGGLAMTPSFAIHKNVIIEGVTSKANVNNGSICGMKFNDLNGNGKKDTGELGLSGWTINLSLGAIQMTATTGADGSYCFNNLAAGTYTISESQQGGWRQTYPASPGTQTVTLATGQSVVNIDLGNKRLLGKISGTKFNDINGTGDQQTAEPGLPNWTINLTGPISASTTTDNNGHYEFDNLPAGTYTITETNQSGWQQIYPASPGSYIIILGEGESLFGKDFANQIIPPKLGSICGMKFNDLNGNGIKDASEPGLSGWTINLSSGTIQLSATTDANGEYCFNNLVVGTYTLTEINKPGWKQTKPSSPNSYTIKLTSDQNLIAIDFGNQESFNPSCTDFENNSLNGWQGNNTGVSIQKNGNNHFIQTTDQSGVSTFFNSSKPLTGNWTNLFTNGCGSLCFDVTFLYGGNPYNGVNPPQSMYPYVAIEGNGFAARFLINSPINVGDGWHSYCTPLSFQNSDGTLPSNADGQWIMTVGTPNDWNSLLSNVTKVYFPIDPTSFQSEKFGFDNICLKNTGDCNPTIKLGSICGIKIHDKNGDGVKDPNEDGLPNWTINLFNGTTTISTTTDANGNYCFNDLPAGTYTVSETNQPNWRQIFPAVTGTHTVTLLSGQKITNINFSNVEDPAVQLGSICGMKFNDLNGNGRKDDWEPAIANLQFNLTGAVNLTTTTDLNGYFCFTQLRPGSYTIREVIQNGWKPTAPDTTGTLNVKLTSGQNLSEIYFGNKQISSSICGIKFNDKNGNGIQDDGELGLADWVINLTGTMKLNTKTDATGNFCFSNLRPGKYTVAEVNQNGWTQTAPSTLTYSFDLKPGESISKLIFGNKVDPSVKLGSICGIKFNDLNGNGKQDFGELGIPDWQIQIGGLVDMSATTDKNGNFCFDNLPPGEYKVSEVMRTGWKQTLPATNYYIIQLASGQSLNNVYFGNKEDASVQLGSICGIKFNDKNGNGKKDDGELGLPNWTINLNGAMSLTVTTDDKGNYCFTGLIPGKYTISEINKPGWRQTAPSLPTYSFTIGNGDNFKEINFGNKEDASVILGSICGIKFNDINGNGKQDEGEPGIANWTINLTGDATLTTRTDLRGRFCFDNLKMGNYVVSELFKDGWTQTAPSTGSYSIVLTEDKNADDLYFGNKVDIDVRLGSICGMKFNDKNGNGKQDDGELGIPDWTINLSGSVEMKIKTDREGRYCFDNLKPGEYIIKEEMQTNWRQTFPTSPGSYSLVLASGQSLKDYNFGNKYEPKVGCVNPPKDMVAWWSFDLSSRDNRQDLAGYNNFGTMKNGPTQVAGKVLGALQFDGIDDYVEVADQSELNFGTGDFSFDAWIKTDAKVGVEVIVDKRQGYNVGYSFFLNDGNLSLQLADASFPFSYTNYSSSFFVADDKWHHIAITVKRNNSLGILFYLDGDSVQYGDPTSHTASLTNTDNLRIGRNSSAINLDPIGTFKGILDEIELFKRVLTKEEIVSIYNAGSAGKCKPDGSLSSVWGHVFHDINYNGVIDAKDPNLSKWTVLINGPTIATTITDVDGNFGFTNLKPGNYTISVAKPNNWFQTHPNKGNYSFSLEVDQSIDAINFGFANDPCLAGIKAWSPLGTGASATVNALAAKGNNLFVGGNFLTAGGIQVNHIAKLNGSNWSALAGGVNGPVNAILVVGNDTYVGGFFTMAGNVNANNIAKWNGSNWSAFGDGTNGAVSSLAVVGNDIYAGGLFTTAGGVSAKNIAKWNGANWSALGNGVNQNGSYGVLALAVIGADLYVGGGFWGTGGASGSPNIVKWNTLNSTWSPLSSGFNDRVFALSVMNSELYAGGSFDNSGGFNAVNHIAKWDGSNWLPLSSGTSGGVSGSNWALTSLNNELYIGGQFANAGSVSSNAVAKWDGSTWTSLGNGVGGYYYSTVRALAVIGSDIYAGGIFTTADGINANNIARYSCFSTVTSIEDNNSRDIIPLHFQLDQNYPNPFNPTTTIRYSISKIGFVKIIVYDILGREIRVLVNEEKYPGVYSATFDAKNLASGIYFYTINAAGFTQSKKMILLK